MKGNMACLRIEYGISSEMQVKLEFSIQQRSCACVSPSKRLRYASLCSENTQLLTLKLRLHIRTTGGSGRSLLIQLHFAIALTLAEEDDLYRQIVTVAPTVGSWQR